MKEVKEDTATRPSANSPGAVVPWGPVSAVLLTIAIFFGGQVLGLMIFLVGLAIFSRSPLEAAIDMLANANTTYQFFSVVAVEAVTVGLLYLFLRARKAGFASLGLRSFRVVDLLKALIGYGVYFMVYYAAIIVISAVVPGINLNQEQEIGFDRSVIGLALVPVFISLVALPALVEEIIMRGFLFSGLRTKFNFVVSAIVTSILFAAAHLQWGGGSPLLWVAAIDTFILSVVLCYLREKTGTLWAPIALHGLKNTIAFAVLFIFKIA